MTRLLLDTHIVIRWLFEPNRLSREQSGALARAVQRMEPAAPSAISLLEIAILYIDGKLLLPSGLEALFDDLERNPMFQVLPLIYEVASEAASLAG
jgi:PIN domain nuclease of toxin-antitoxin system